MPPRKRRQAEEQAEARRADEPQLPPRRACGTTAVHHRLLARDDAYVQARNSAENTHFAVRTGRRPLPNWRIVTIPVVVHIVHDTAASDVTDEQVRSQLDVLNRDFRMANPDIESVPIPFRPLAADTGIQFALAGLDPDDETTEGITRTRTRRRSFSPDDDAAAPAWPADRYLNIWVVPWLADASGDLHGYAQYSGGPAETDGVVVVQSAFGVGGTAEPPFDLGRTLTHQVGHWLDLRHIWGDDGDGCNGDDFVADTPNQAGPNYGQPAFPHVSFANGPHGDLFVNFMDAVDDVAMCMFTVGQAVRARTCVEHARGGLGATAAVPEAATENGGQEPTSPDAQWFAAGAQQEMGRYQAALGALAQAEAEGRLGPVDRQQAGALYGEYLAFVDYVQQRLRS